MTEPIVINGLEGLKNNIGQRFGPGQWIEITQERIDAFAEATGDRQWIHTDPVRAAKESPFGSTVAHGYLTLSLTPVLIEELYRIDGVSMMVNVGIEKMSLREPVRAGARVRLQAELKRIRNLPSGGARVTVGLIFELEGARRPACSCDSVVVYLP